MKFKLTSITAVGAVVLACCATALATGGDRTLTAKQTFNLKPGATKTFQLAYPDALEYGGAKYSGKVKLLKPTGHHGVTASLSLVKVVSQSSCMGGSEYCVKVDNTNAANSGSVRVAVTTQTRLP